MKQQSARCAAETLALDETRKPPRTIARPFHSSPIERLDAAANLPALRGIRYSAVSSGFAAGGEASTCTQPAQSGCAGRGT